MTRSARYAHDPSQCSDGGLVGMQDTKKSEISDLQQVEECLSVCLLDLGMARAGIDYESSYGKVRANDTILKLQRTTPYYKRNRAHVCSFYARSMHKRFGCPYRHEMPETEVSQQNIRTVTIELMILWRWKLPNKAGEMPSLEPLMVSIRTLYVGGVDAESRGCAFVTYTTREGAEKAAEELANKLNQLPPPQALRNNPYRAILQQLQCLSRKEHIIRQWILQRMGAVVPSQEGLLVQLQSGPENKIGSEKHPQGQHYAYPPAPPPQGQFYPPYYPPPWVYAYHRLHIISSIPALSSHQTTSPPPAGEQAAYQQKPQPVAAETTTLISSVLSKLLWSGRICHSPDLESLGLRSETRPFCLFWYATRCSMSFGA
ncbi:hypothetical protein HAX54_040543 [Datura stramonium]|uniref:RRM domain-containing protein n=1 Tax=Datura stramonium TaxID=4076 RepID=A0ABS8SK37_DATST|nr:hypothetical protein [Datura stramonium]